MPAGFTKEDSMFYVGSTPWHGLGTELPNLATAEQALKAASLEWTVAKDDTRVALDRRPHCTGLVRQDTGYLLSVVPRNYHIIQNADAFRFFDEVTMDPGGPKYAVAGSLYGGKIVWMLAWVGHVVEVVKDDPIESYLLLVNGHDGETGMQMFFTPVRVVCQNTLMLAMSAVRTNDVWLAGLHGRELGEQDVLDARKVLGIVQRKMGDHREFLEKLAREQATTRDLVGVLSYVYGADGFLRRVGIVTDLLLNGPGTDKPGVKGTLYGLLNAITDLEDHYWLEPPASASAREERLHSVILGEAAQRKQAAVRWMEMRLNGDEPNGFSEWRRSENYEHNPFSRLGIGNGYPGAGSLTPGSKR